MPRQVLICDDAMFMRSVIASVLTGAGYAIAGEAGSGADAVAQFKALAPDLVTMDLIMPEMGGIDAVRAIHGLDPQARIIVCSAMGQEPLVKQAIEAGAAGFVVKPFTPETLLAAVEKAFAGAPAAETVR